MKVFVINCGSSSIKFKLFEAETCEKRVVADGYVENIGGEQPNFVRRTEENEVSRACAARNHDQAMAVIIDSLVDNIEAGLRDIEEISCVGHRIVHGGDTFF